MPRDSLEHSGGTVGFFLERITANVTLTSASSGDSYDARPTGNLPADEAAGTADVLPWRAHVIITREAGALERPKQIIHRWSRADGCVMNAIAAKHATGNYKRALCVGTVFPRATDAATVSPTVSLPMLHLRGQGSRRSV